MDPFNYLYTPCWMRMQIHLWLYGGTESIADWIVLKWPPPPPPPPTTIVVVHVNLIFRWFVVAMPEGNANNKAMKMHINPAPILDWNVWDLGHKMAQIYIFDCFITLRFLNTDWTHRLICFYLLLCSLIPNIKLIEFMGFVFLLWL